MQTTDAGATVRELLAIVDIDATPVLALLGLVQRDLPAALAICDGELIAAMARFTESRRAEITHFGATLNTRDVNRAALRKQGLSTGLIEGFLGDSARPRYPGESDPFLKVARIDWSGVSALVNAHNLACLLTAPDHVLVDTMLPEPDARTPRTPAQRPTYLCLAKPADVPPNVDASALKTLVLNISTPWPGLHTLLASAEGLRRLELGDAALLDSGVFDGLPLAALEQLDVCGAQTLTASGWARASTWRTLRRLRINGVGLGANDLALLGSIAQAPFWTALTELDLGVFRQRDSTIDPTLWASLWADREFALQTLHLRYLDAPCLSSVWRGRFPHLRTLDVANNDLGETLGAALQGANLPQLAALDVRGNNLSPTAVRAFALNHGFPALRRIAVSLYSAVEEDYTDWNGAVVGRGPVPMGAAEIERDWLAGSGLRCWDGIAARS